MTVDLFGYEKVNLSMRYQAGLVQLHFYLLHRNLISAYLFEILKPDGAGEGYSRDTCLEIARQQSGYLP